jgi:threonine/homoserine/homoserine lactone efflux protein
MSTGLLFITSLVVGFSGAITPGPLFVACVTRSARDGPKGGLWVATGHAVVEFILVVGLVLGLGSVLVRPGVAPAISLVGGLTLIWMGYGTAAAALRDNMTTPRTEHTGRGGKLSGEGGDQPRVPGASGAVLAGVAATLSGPYWSIWWATVGLSYLTLAAPLGIVGVGAFYVGHVLADYVWYSAVAVAVAGGRRLLSGRGYRYLLMACGLALLALGVLFAGKGLLSLIGPG